MSDLLTENSDNNSGAAEICSSKASESSETGTNSDRRRAIDADHLFVREALPDVAILTLTHEYVTVVIMSVLLTTNDLLSVTYCFS